jgi:hypothetical protein
MLAPFHAQLKVGPVLRGEGDWRLYWRQFRPTQEEIAGLRRLWVLATWARIPEATIAAGALSTADRAVVEFSAMTDFFAPLNGQNGTVRHELERSVDPYWLAVAAGLELAPIGIHVRLGDFEDPSSEADFFSRGFLRTPVSWFMGTLAFIRQQVGSTVPAFVVSDGERADLNDLLALPAVRLVRTGSAISDLLALSRAKVLLGSGGSSFSAWASYLGEMPAITRAGQSLTWFNLSQTNGAFVGEFTPGDAPPEMLLEGLRPLS